MKYSQKYYGLLIFLVVCGLSFGYAQTELPPLRWYQWDEGLTAAQAGGKKVIVDVYTTWCGWCKKMDRSSYRHPMVQELLDTYFIPVKLNAESSRPVFFVDAQVSEEEVAAKLRVKSFPTTIVLDEQLTLIYRKEGYMGPQEFYVFLKYFSSNAYQQMTFEEYESTGGDNRK